MGFEGIFGRGLFGRKGLDQHARPQTLDASMCAELQRLDLYRRGLGDDAIRFVASGENPAILDTLAKCDRTYQAPYHKDTDGRVAAKIAVDTALVNGAIRPGPEVGRFMAVRFALGFSHLPYRSQAASPAEIAVTGVFGAIDTGLAVSQNTYKIPWNALIPLDRLLKLVESVGGGVVDLFGYILRRNDTAYLSEPDSWHVHASFGDLVRAHPAAFAQVLSTVDPKYRAAALALAAHHGVDRLPEILSSIVALLTRPFGKADHEIAISALARLDAALLQATIEQALPGADIDTRFGLMQAAARNGAAPLLAMLADRAKVEKAAKVRAAIDAVLEATQELAEPSDTSGYTAIDGSFVAIPPMVDLGDDTAPPPSDAECAAYLDCVDAISAVRAKKLAEQVPGSRDDHSKYYQPLSREEIEATFELMTAGTPLPAGTTYVLIAALRAREDGSAWYRAVLDRLPLGVGLRSLLGCTLGELRSFFETNTWINSGARWSIDRLREGLEAGTYDLRELMAVAHAMGTARAAAMGQPVSPPDPVGLLRIHLTTPGYSYDRAPYESPLAALPAAAVWPLLAENLSIFDEAFGLQPAAKPILLDRALTTLALLPAVPQRYLAALIEIAVTGKPSLRRQARTLLRAATDLDRRVAALLDDARQGVRIAAATWLADLRATDGVAALRKRLKKEKSDPVRAALIESLQRLGADLSDVIGPASLIAEAEKALAKGVADLPVWISGATLPAIRFRDGTTAPAALLRHWLTLAIRLKDPGATGQFGIYLDQLDPADARALSAWLLDGWIAFDTKVATLEEANAYALANYAQDYRWQFKWQPQTAELRDTIVAELRRQKMGELLNSGSDSKGVLALACRAEPVWAANRVRWYLKAHGRRSHQAMALLDVLAGIGAPVALQVVIAASVRLKQKSTQAHATAIAERYAEDRGWSIDELADRTVPTAGFDDDGVLELPCGEDGRVYSARIDASLSIHLFNPDGKAVKSLPAGDDEATRESAKALSAAKKELKQVVELQAERLFEAMCGERSWAVADWRSAFHEHPVMRRLVERLVWQGIDAAGTPLGLFRPTQEGDFTDAADAAVDIDGFARVRLAHGALVDANTWQAWIAHLKDYAVTPFLVQFDAVRAPLSADMAQAEAVGDRLGWVALSLSYRGLAEKRGYARVMGDGGGCSEYAKTFAGRGIVATIHHSGSNAEDENNPVALKHLSFDTVRRRGVLALKDVPPVVRAECWADYHALAAKGAFNPEWEKVAAW